ncbi:MAG: hypothetical protein IT375_13695 [Polyangiaceae bacterium]|nr:hypothetical protein [Polyangiaceae bacterium]
MTAKSGPLLSTVFLRQAQIGHGPRCLGCAAVRVEAAAIDHADREVELLEAEAEANAAGQKLLATARAVRRARARRRGQ